MLYPRPSYFKLKNHQKFVSKAFLEELFSLPIYLPAIAYSNHQDAQDLILNEADDAAITDAVFPKFAEL